MFNDKLYQTFRNSLQCCTKKYTRVSSQKGVFLQNLSGLAGLTWEGVGGGTVSARLSSDDIYLYAFILVFVFVFQISKALEMNKKKTGRKSARVVV